MAAPADPPRRETFLARYPRKLKIGALAVILLMIILPFALSGGRSDAIKEAAVKAKTAIAVVVSGADTPESAALPGASGPGTGVNIAASAGDEEKSAAEESTHILMTPAPDPGLSEDTSEGSLPRVSEDGRQPWQVYARPFSGEDKRPRVAVVITDLGLSRLASDTAIDRLPPNVTLAFDAQSPVVGSWLARARQAGHETLMMVPMEPFDYPRSDPGPNTLLSNLPNKDNLQRLLWALRQGSGYIGITTLSGSRFTTEPEKITPVLDVLHKRGLMMFDARVAPHSAIADLAKGARVPVAIQTTRLEQNLAPEAIDAALSQLEQAARLQGRAVITAPPLPVVIDRLALWIKQLPRDGIALAPLSAVTQQ